MNDQKGKTLAIIGAIFSLGPVLGMVGSVVAMVLAFQTMGAKGAASPEALAANIGLHIFSQAAGILLGAIGIIFILIALLRVKYRAPWFFNAGCVVSVLWMFGFPIGTIAGIMLLIYLQKHKTEFKPPQSGTPS
jgi:hypothetical protein